MAAPLKWGTDGRPFEFSTSDLVDSINLGTGTRDSTTVLRGDATWAAAVTGGWSVGLDLSFTSTTTVTAGSRQIVPTTAGLAINVPTTKILDLQIAASSYAQLSTTAFALQGAVGLTFGSSGNVSSSTRGMWGTSNGLEFNAPSGTYHIFKLAGTSLVSIQADRIEVGGTYGVSFTNSSGSISSGLAQWARTSSGMTGNTPTGTTWDMQIAGSSVLTMTASLATLYSTNGLRFNSTGSVTAANMQITGTSNGLTLNTPTSSYFDFKTNGTSILYVSTGGGLLFPTDGTSAAGNRGISPTSAGLLYGVTTATNHQFQVAGTTYVTLSDTLATFAMAGGIYFGTTSGSATAANNQILATSVGLVHNTPTSKKHSFQIAATENAYIDASFIYAGNTNHFGMSSGGAVSSTARQLVGVSTGVALNTPASTDILFSIGGTNRLIIEDKYVYNNPSTNGTNTTFGYVAGDNLNGTSSSNTLFGYVAGRYLNTGSSYNVCVGSNSGPVSANVSNGGVHIGYYSGGGNSTGAYNLNAGYAAMYCVGGSYVTGSYNIFLGYFAGPNTVAATSLSNNIGIGKNSSQYLTTGSDNIALGSSSLQLATTCTYQIAIGLNAMGGATNTGTLGIALGAASLYNLTSSSYPIAIGYQAGYGITSGSSDMIAIGRSSMGGSVSTSGYSGAVAIGYNAMLYVNGNYHVALGLNAMGGGGGTSSTSNSGTSCVALGPLALYMLTTASYVVGLGYSAGYAVAGGSDIIAIGRNSLNGTYSGTVTDCIAIGQLAMASVNGCAYNIAIGSFALNSATAISGSYNNGIGYGALNSLTSGSYNLAWGANSGSGVTSGSYNLILGPYRGGYGLTTSTYAIAIGVSAMYNCPGAHSDNIAIGQEACYILTSASYENVGIGKQAFGRSSAGSSGYGNVALSTLALGRITSGNQNVVIGYYSGYDATLGITSGSRNIIIGASLNVGSATGDDQINIGGALLRNTSGVVSLYHGSTGSTLVCSTSSTAFTLASGIKLIVASSSTPASASDTGTTGTIAWDSSYLYVCTATNTWKRVAIATW